MTYRKFNSRYGWNRPHTPGWLGYTWGFRIALLGFLVWIVLR